MYICCQWVSRQWRKLWLKWGHWRVAWLWWCVLHTVPLIVTKLLNKATLWGVFLENRPMRLELVCYELGLGKWTSGHIPHIHTGGRMGVWVRTRSVWGWDLSWGCVHSWLALEMALMWSKTIDLPKVCFLRCLYLPCGNSLSTFFVS